MRQVHLFIAMSLDGCIADSRGSVDWLHGYDDGAKEADPYSDFIREIDTVLMGRNTWHQIVTELSPTEWPYPDLTTYVITHHPSASTEQIHFTDTDPAVLLAQLQKEPGKGIWICGGAHLVQQLIRENLIDRYHITVIPTLLGSGIRLFENGNREIPLKLVQTRSYQGMTDLIYVRR